VLIISWSSWGAASLSSSASAQPITQDKPGLRDFGSSLKRNSNQQDKKSKNKKGKSGDADADDDIVRVETTLVVSDVLVLDKQGRSIAGLKKEDFVVKEDNQQQEIGTFALDDGGTIPRAVVLIIDYSGSQLPYIKTSVEAAKTLVDKLGPKDKMAIVTDDVELLVDFTRDKALLREKLESLKESASSGKVGRSEQYSALMATLNEMFDQEDLRPIIIFQTDGDELGRLKGNEPPNRHIAKRNFSFDDVLTAAEKSRATIYTIIPGIRFIGLSSDEQLKRAKVDLENRIEAHATAHKMAASKSNQSVMSERFLDGYVRFMLRTQLAIAGIAKFTGGWVDYLEQPEQANEIYSRIFTGINSRYVIGYYPTNRTRDGKQRKVKIEVRGHSEYIIWGRKTYFAPDPEE
ncbi:MAG: VWA domain-containing protein, partial [Acidobacteriota bacterium]|nr:VWA domain-containing protein [Acidobacteriota bacterium]